MKRNITLMVAALVTGVAWAGSISWSADGVLYDGREALSELVTERPIAYLMCVVESFTKDDLVAAFEGACKSHTSPLPVMQNSEAWIGPGGSVSADARLTGLESDFTTLNSSMVYAVVLRDDEMFISPEALTVSDGVGSSALIGTITDYSKLKYGTDKLYQGPGWYAYGDGGGSADPIPEPTSSILLLIGMAGLMLRRRWSRTE